MPSTPILRAVLLRLSTGLDYRLAYRKNKHCRGMRPQRSRDPAIAVVAIAEKWFLTCLVVSNDLGDATVRP
jgi:hypothetical protein